MADPRFYKREGPYTLIQLAEIAGVEMNEEPVVDRIFTDVGPLISAGPKQISFLDNVRYADVFCKSNA